MLICIAYTIQNVYFGYEFDQILNTSKSNDEKKRQLKERCLRFLQVLLKQLQQRLPKNIDILETISSLSVQNTLKVIKDPLTGLAQLLKIDVRTIDKINVQWANILSVKWMEKSNTIKFWNEVLSYTDASGLNPFQDLANLAMQILVLPWSNAEVERLFSQMNVVKNKLRNRMGPKLLDSILTIRSGLKRHKVCCSKYVLPKNIIGKSSVYSSSAIQNNGDADAEIISVDNTEEFIIF